MIKFENVSKYYGKQNSIGLKDISVHIRRGEFVFLVGQSGAGKSTFIKLILKEIEPSAGELYVNDTDVANLSKRNVPKYRRNIGMVFQDFRLLEKKTVYENLAFAMEISNYSGAYIKQRIKSVLAMVHLSGKENMYPGELSGGEQQRVGIARALLNSPTLIIADEPTGNLDPLNAKEIMDLMLEINRRGITILIATHAHVLVDIMQKRVIELRNGSIVRDAMEGRYVGGFY